MFFSPSEPIPKSKTQFDAFTREQQTPFIVPKEECESDSDGSDDLPVEAGRKPERRHKAHSKEPQISLAHVVKEAVKEVWRFNNNIWHLHSLSVDEIQSYV